jgi:hypothetical protein
MKNLRTLAVAALCLGALTAGVQANSVGTGEPNYGSVNGLLSDFQQRYGQVVGQQLVGASGGSIESLTVYGVYYNYSNSVNNPPTADDFTLRLHQIVDGDPAEAYYFQQNIGAGVRSDTGEDLTAGSIVLDIYQYDFAGLSIPVGSGAPLLSVINDTVNPTVDGYWHWVSANNDGTSWWRREDEQPAGQEITFFWVEGSEFNGNRAFQAEIVPEPLTMLAVFGGCGALGGYIRRRRSA